VDLKFKIVARLIDKLVSLDVKYEAIFEKVGISFLPKVARDFILFFMLMNNFNANLQKPKGLGLGLLVFLTQLINFWMF
jgi:hypothetical protein